MTSCLPRPPQGLYLATLCLVLTAWAAIVPAGEPFQVVPLRHRSANEMIRLLRPLLQRGEAISGTGDRLVLRAPTERAGELQRLVRQLDRPLHRIRIQLRYASSPPRAADPARHVHRTVPDRDRALYQVTGLEQRPLFIRFGHAMPIPTGLFPDLALEPTGDGNQGIRYQPLVSGFYAVALVQGRTVRLDISPRREVLASGGGGEIRLQGLVTRVRGPLNHWLYLGGRRHPPAPATHAARIHRTEPRNPADFGFWVRVVVLP